MRTPAGVAGASAGVVAGFGCDAAERGVVALVVVFVGAFNAVGGVLVVVVGLLDYAVGGWAGRGSEVLGLAGGLATALVTVEAAGERFRFVLDHGLGDVLCVKACLRRVGEG